MSKLTAKQTALESKAEGIVGAQDAKRHVRNRQSLINPGIRDISKKIQPIDALRIDGVPLLTTKASEKLSSLRGNELYEALMTFLLERDPEVEVDGRKFGESISATDAITILEISKIGLFSGKEWDAERSTHIKTLIIKPLIPKETMFTCNKCRSSNIDYESKQVRAADEGMTTFFACQDCSYRWMVN